MNATERPELRGGMEPPEIKIYLIGHLGDNHAGAQVVTIGPNSSVENITLNRIQLQQSTIFNLTELSRDLHRLREVMHQETVTREQSEATACVALAEVKANEGDEIATLGLLKAAGHWALEIAQKAGFEIAALAIAHVIQP